MATACAREGAGVALPHPADQEPDAEEVVRIIRTCAQAEAHNQLRETSASLEIGALKPVHVARKDPSMAATKNPSPKAMQLYAELRDDGASQQKAAGISNAAAKGGRSGAARGKIPRI